MTTMPESLSRAFEALREFMGGLGWGAIGDNPTLASLWKTATTPQGIALIATVFVALTLGLLLGMLLARPRPRVPEAAPASAVPPPESPFEAAPSTDAAAAALRQTLKSLGLSETAAATRVETFVAGLANTRATLQALRAEDEETAPLIAEAVHALDHGDFDATVRTLDLVRGRFAATGRALASRADRLCLAAATAATIAGDLEMSRCAYAAAGKLFARALDRLPKAEAGRAVPLLIKQATAAFRDGAAAQAEALLRQAVGIAERTYGENHPEVAKTVSSLAFVRFAAGNPADADHLYRKALAIDEKALGSEHPDVANDLTSLAQLLFRQGNRPAAEPLLKRSLAIRQKALGPTHPDTIRAVRNYADLLRQMGRTEEAEQVVADADLARRQAEHAAE